MSYAIVEVVKGGHAVLTLHLTTDELQMIVNAIAAVYYPEGGSALYNLERKLCEVSGLETQDDAVVRMRSNAALELTADSMRLILARRTTNLEVIEKLEHNDETVELVCETQEADMFLVRIFVAKEFANKL